MHVGFFQLYVHDFYSTWNTYCSTGMGMLYCLHIHHYYQNNYMHVYDKNYFLFTIHFKVRIIELLWLVNFGNIIQLERFLHILSEMIWFIDCSILHDFYSMWNTYCSTGMGMLYCLHIHHYYQNNYMHVYVWWEWFVC
jgi:hypothetical protein